MHSLGVKAAGPINALANKMGSRGFLPSTLDQECDKAAAILNSFCKEGAYGEGQRPTTPTAPATTGETTAPDGTPIKRARSRDRALFTIPQSVLSKAVGLAIFTTARVGFEVSLATGSGILIARLPDGAWGPPSAIQVHTLGAGFLVGLDIYDCVCVINTKEALSAFTKTRVALGTEVSVAAGPFGAGGKLDMGTGAGHPRRQDGPPLPTSEKPSDTAVLAGETYPGQQHATEPPVDSSKLSAETHRPKTHHRRSSSKTFGPVFTYVKSRGFFAGVHVDGTVITERKEANHAFYGARLPAEQILRGEGVVNQQGPKLWPGGARALLEALKQAERERPREEVLVSPTVATPAIAQPPPNVTMPAAAEPPPRVEPVGAQVQAQRETQGKEGAVPAYVQPADDGPPPYVEDGTVHPGVGDQKLPPPQ